LRLEVHVNLDADAHAALDGGQLAQVNVAGFAFVAVDQAKGEVLVAVRGGLGKFGDEPRPVAARIEQFDVDDGFVAKALLAGLGWLRSSR